MPSLTEGVAGANGSTKKPKLTKNQMKRARKTEKKKDVIWEEDDIPDEDEDNAELVEQKLSKKQRKLRDKLSIAELKALVKKPDIVEWTDVDATDPRLLVHLKSYRNVVPVPAHWGLKREYLSSKRGVEKAQFQLPAFIAATGIGEMRDALLEKQAEQNLKQKQRERVQPKMGKLDVDYQKLYEAFFRFQTKPELTRYGEVYYEGKEYETNLRHLRPGELTAELKEALNIPPGAPPPWLINMQRFGPPPSYPNLRIPGLNAPPPPGAQWGFHPGGYGKPPVDEFNRPLFGGDIFGIMQTQQPQQMGEPVEKTLWGELQAPEESEEEDEDSDDGDEDEDEDLEDANSPLAKAPVEAISSFVPGDYAPSNENLDVRKSRGNVDAESDGPKSLYTVLPEQQVQTQGFFGSDRAYNLSNQNASLPVLGTDQDRKRKRTGDVEVALDPDALLENDGISKEEVSRRFEEQREKQKGGDWGFQEDLSEMIAAESRRKTKQQELKKSKK
jgi:splicing factor 3B subunit 2